MPFYCVNTALHCIVLYDIVLYLRIYCFVMLHNCVGQEKDGWQEVKSRKKKRVNFSPVKLCKFDEKCNKGRFCSFTHTKWSKMTKSIMPSQMEV